MQKLNPVKSCLDSLSSLGREGVERQIRARAQSVLQAFLDAATARSMTVGVCAAWQGRAQHNGWGGAACGGEMLQN